MYLIGKRKCTKNKIQEDETEPRKGSSNASRELHLLLGCSTADSASAEPQPAGIVKMRLLTSNWNPFKEYL